MKKYLVIGNPISHSLSPKLQNYWIKNHNIDAIYEKQKLTFVGSVSKDHTSCVWETHLKSVSAQHVPQGPEVTILTFILPGMG